VLAYRNGLKDSMYKAKVKASGLWGQGIYSKFKSLCSV